MTTPRVTVPPYALEAIAFNLCSLHDFDVAFVRENERFATAVITEYVRSLSAAPAPEGGAVLDAQAVTLEWDRVDTTALEEWRAGLGDYDVRVVLGHDNVWSYRVNNSGYLGFTSADEAKAQALSALRKRLSARLNDARATVALYDTALATREDAQPFGHWVEHRSGENPVLIRYGSFVPASDHYKITTLYTHPAPDALRVAVEALEAARKVIELFRDEDVLSEGVHAGLRKGTDAKDAHDLWTAIRNSKTSAWSDAIAFALDPYFSMWGGDAAVAKIDQALAALQAEQKGGAA